MKIFGLWQKPYFLPFFVSVIPDKSMWNAVLKVLRKRKTRRSGFSKRYKDRNAKFSVMADASSSDCEYHVSYRVAFE